MCFSFDFRNGIYVERKPNDGPTTDHPDPVIATATPAEFIVGLISYLRNVGVGLTAPIIIYIVLLSVNTCADTVSFFEMCLSCVK